MGGVYPAPKAAGKARGLSEAYRTLRLFSGQQCSAPIANPSKSATVNPLPFLRVNRSCHLTATVQLFKLLYITEYMFPQKEGIMLRLLAAIGFGLLIAYSDSRPTWDDAGITALALLIACGLFGFLAPSRP